MNPDAVLLIIKLIGGILTIASLLYGFFKVVQTSAKMEADLRNEIQNVKEDVSKLETLHNKVLDRMDIVVVRLQDLGVLDMNNKVSDKRINSLENCYREILEELKCISKDITTIKIDMAQKANRQ